MNYFLIIITKEDSHENCGFILASIEIKTQLLGDLGFYDIL
jgi:hypothetical protein